MVVGVSTHLIRPIPRLWAQNGSPWEKTVAFRLLLMSVARCELGTLDTRWHFSPRGVLGGAPSIPNPILQRGKWAPEKFQ